MANTLSFLLTSSTNTALKLLDKANSHKKNVFLIHVYQKIFL